MLTIFHILAAIVFATLTFIIFKSSNKKNKNAPPGPQGVSWLGNILQVGTNPMDTINNWCKKYGPILQVNIGGQKVIFLNDANYIREMFNEPAFIGKPIHHILMLLSDGPWGVISTEGETWEAHRRFTLRGLRDFGFSKSSMEDLIAIEIDETLDWFKEHNGKTLEVGQNFNIAVSNSLWTIINGLRNNQDDSKISQIMHDFLRTFNLLFQRGAFIFPWLRFLVPEWCGYNDLKANINSLNAFIVKAVKEHVKTFTEDSPRDFIDLYLQEIKNAKPGSAFYGEIGERHMIATITDIFMAGNETTSVTLNWAMLYLCRHPKVQDTLYNEIVKVVGENRMPLLSDRSSMPYTESVLMEVLRRSALVPFGVPHRADRNKEFKGYMIEKDTIILAHLQYAMNNEDVWENPECFLPERFLNKDRKIVKNVNLIPFQGGKRQCLGESLARDTLFLFLASIIQQFEILPDPENPKPELEPVLGFINSPKPFKVSLRQRNK